jgi:hypothetical protein
MNRDVWIEVREIHIQAISEQRFKRDHPLLDQLTDGDAGEEFSAGGDAKSRAGCIGNLLRAIGESVAFGKDRFVPGVHQYNARKWVTFDLFVDGFFEFRSTDRHDGLFPLRLRN